MERGDTKNGGTKGWWLILAFVLLACGEPIADDEGLGDIDQVDNMGDTTDDGDSNENGETITEDDDEYEDDDSDTEENDEEITEDDDEYEDEEDDENEHDDESGQETYESADSSSFPSCGKSKELFGTEPLDLSNYMSITPLGNLNPSGHTFPTVHTYIMLKDNTKASPVYAPGDLTITNATSLTAESTGKTDYSIDFTSCREVTGYFKHITKLTPALLEKIGNFSNCNRYNPGDGYFNSCNKSVSIEISEGEVIGYAGGPTTTGSAAIDFGLRDSREKKIKYVNPDMLINKDQVYVVCPYDYYKSGKIRDNLFDKLKVERTVDPICGTVDLDIAGTAQGRWYLQGSVWSTSEADHLALVPSNRNPTVGVLSVGHSQIGTNPYHFDMTFSGQTRRDFEDVTNNGNIYCYDSLRNRADAANSQPLSGYLFLKMISSTTLKLERVNSGSCPNNPSALSFSSNAVTFER